MGLEEPTEFKRFVGKIGKIPAIDKLPVERQVVFAEVIQHIAMVQMLLRNGGEFIVELGNEADMKMQMELKLGVRGLGNNQFIVKLATKDGSNLGDGE